MNNGIMEQNELVLDEVIRASFKRSREDLIESIDNIMWENEEYLTHYGVGHLDDPPGRGSGRYEYMSGANPGQHGLKYKDLASTVKTLKAEGLTDPEIAKALGFKSTVQLRAHISIEKERRQRYLSTQIPTLRAEGMTTRAIAEKIGISEASVRNYLNADRVIQMDKTRNVAETLKQELATKRYIDVTSGTELELNISKERLKTAIEMLEAEGYIKYRLDVEQLTHPGQYTTMMVLGAPGTEWSEIQKDPTKIKTVQSYFEDNGKTALGLLPVQSIDSSRIHIRYNEEGGADREGIIQLRRGVEDLSLGRSYYSQVRVAVDNKYYLKGMAIYADDDQFPPGCDIIFNTIKTSDVPPEKVFKELEHDKDWNVNWDNPFGSSIKPVTRGGQYKYVDSKTGEVKIGAINKVNDQGDWQEWSKTISPQMLSKQDRALIEKQLGATIEDRRAEYADIMAVTNPTVRRILLDSFAEDCDAAASHLKAKAFPGQSINVLIATPELKPDQCFTPNYPHGEKLALVRYPHNGPCEIVEVTNNLRNSDAIKTIGANAPDAICLHPSQFQKLSGADSDGDTVVTIPLSKNKIKIEPILEGLRNFDPKSYKFPDPDAPGITLMTKENRGNEMGRVTNLIADMGMIGNYTPDEMTRAIKHSMVVIDAEKHKLDYKQSEIDHRIKELKDKYQGGGGASTLITRANSEAHINQRRPGFYEDPITGKKTKGVNPNTGEKIWEETGATYPKKITPKKKEPYTVDVLKKETVTKMDLAKDAMELLSSQTNPHPTEVIYGNYANTLKKMANEARKTAVNTPKLERNPAAAKEYASEVESLNTRLTIALKNAPRERQALVVGRSIYNAQLAANPELKHDKEAMKKLRTQAMNQGRDLMGAKKQRIQLTEREVEAIQKGAISDTKLRSIIANADMDSVRAAFTPKTSKGITSAMERLAISMARNGYTNADIANRLGISPSSVSKIINT